MTRTSVENYNIKKDVFRKHGKNFRSAKKAIAFCQLQTMQGFNAFFDFVDGLIEIRTNDKGDIVGLETFGGKV